MVVRNARLEVLRNAQGQRSARLVDKRSAIRIPTTSSGRLFTNEELFGAAGSQQSQGGFWNGLGRNRLFKYGVIAPLNVLDAGRGYAVSGLKELTDAISPITSFEREDGEPLTPEQQAQVVAAYRSEGALPQGVVAVRDSGSLEDFRRQGKDRIGFRQAILDPRGIDDQLGPFAGVAGFAGDVAFDPLTYATLGAGAAARAGTFAAGRAGKEALAQQVYKTVLRRGDDVVDEVARKAVERQAAYAGREALKGGIGRARRLLSADEAAQIGIPRAGVYMFGKYVRKGNPLRVPLSGAVGSAADQALTKVRLALSPEWLMRKVTPKAMQEARLGLQYGGVTLDKFGETLSAVLSHDARRAAAGAAGREFNDSVRTFLANWKQLRKDPEFAAAVGRALDGSESEVAEAVTAATELRALYDGFFDRIDQELTALDPEATLGRVERYSPHVLSDEARRWMNLSDDAAARDLAVTFGLRANDPIGFFQPRRLKADGTSKFFDRVLRPEDMTIERLNQIARDAGFKGDFFISDPLVALARYGKGWSDQLGTFAAIKHLVDEGHISRIGREFVEDGEAIKAAQKELNRLAGQFEAKFSKAANLADRVMRTLGEQQSKLRSTLSKLEGDKVALLARRDEVITPMINEIKDLRDLVRLAKAELAEATADETAFLDVMRQNGIEMADAVQQQRDELAAYMDELEEALSGAAESGALAEQMIRDAEYFQPLHAERVKEVDEKIKSLQANQKKMFAFANWLGEHLEEIVNKPLDEWSGYSGVVPDPKKTLKALDTALNADLGTVSNTLSTSGRGGFGAFLDEELRRDGSTLNSLIEGLVPKEKLRKSMTHATLEKALDAAMADSSSPLTGGIAGAILLARTERALGEIPENMRPLFDETAEAVNKLLGEHRFDTIVDTYVGGRPSEWWRAQARRWASVNPVIEQHYNHIVALRRSRVRLQSIRDRAQELARTGSQENRLRNAERALWADTALAKLDDEIVTAEARQFELMPNAREQQFADPSGYVELSTGQLPRGARITMGRIFELDAMEYGGQRIVDDVVAALDGVPAGASSREAREVIQARLDEWNKVLADKTVKGSRRAALQRRAAEAEGQLRRLKSADDIFEQAAKEREIRDFAEAKQARGAEVLRLKAVAENPGLDPEVRAQARAEMKALGTKIAAEEATPWSVVATEAEAVKRAQRAQAMEAVEAADEGAILRARVLGDDRVRTRQKALAQIEEFRVISEVAIRWQRVNEHLAKFGVAPPDALLDRILTKVARERQEFWGSKLVGAERSHNAWKALGVGDGSVGAWSRVAALSDDASPATVKKAFIDIMRDYALNLGYAVADKKGRWVDDPWVKALLWDTKWDARPHELNENLTSALAARKEAKAALKRARPGSAEAATWRRALERADEAVARTSADAQEWYLASNPIPVKGGKVNRKVLLGELRRAVARGGKMETVDDLRAAVLELQSQTHLMQDDFARRMYDGLAGAVENANGVATLEQGSLAAAGTVWGVAKLRALEAAAEAAELRAARLAERLEAYEADVFTAKSASKTAKERIERQLRTAQRMRSDERFVLAQERKRKHDLLNVLARLDGWKLTSQHWQDMGVRNRVEFPPTTVKKLQRLLNANGGALWVKRGSKGFWTEVTSVDEILPGEVLHRRILGGTMQVDEATGDLSMFDPLGNAQARQAAQEATDAAAAGKRHDRVLAEIVKLDGDVDGSLVDDPQAAFDALRTMQGQVARSRRLPPAELEALSPTGMGRSKFDPSVGASEASGSRVSYRPTSYEPVGEAQAPRGSEIPSFTQEEWESLYVPNSEAGAVNPVVRERAWNKLRKLAAIYEASEAEGLLTHKLIAPAMSPPDLVAARRAGSARGFAESAAGKYLAKYDDIQRRIGLAAGRGPNPRDAEKLASKARRAVERVANNDLAALRFADIEGKRAERILQRGYRDVNVGDDVDELTEGERLAEAALSPRERLKAKSARRAERRRQAISPADRARLEEKVAAGEEARRALETAGQIPSSGPAFDIFPFHTGNPTDYTPGPAALDEDLVRDVVPSVRSTRAEAGSGDYPFIESSVEGAYLERDLAAGGAEALRDEATGASRQLKIEEARRGRARVAGDTGRQLLRYRKLKLMMEKVAEARASATTAAKSAADADLAATAAGAELGPEIARLTQRLADTEGAAADLLRDTMGQALARRARRMTLQGDVDAFEADLASATAKFDQATAVFGEQGAKLDAKIDATASVLAARAEYLDRFADYMDEVVAGQRPTKKQLADLESAVEAGNAAAATLKRGQRKAGRDWRPLTAGEKVRLSEKVAAGEEAALKLQAARMDDVTLLSHIQAMGMAGAVQALPPDTPLRKTMEAAILAERDLGTLKIDLAQARTDLLTAQTLKKAVPEALDGWASLESWGLPGLKSSPELKEIFDNFKRMQDSTVATGLARFIGWYTKRFKAYATATPGFHVRNAISNVFMVFAAGGDLESMAKAESLYQAWMSARKTDSVNDWLRTLNGEEARRFQEALRAMDAAGPGLQLDALAAATEKGLGGRGLVAKWIDNNAMLRLSRRAGERIEGSARFMLAYDSVAKGMDFNMATARVKRYLFDYSWDGRSQLDESMTQIIPFWMWMSRNLPLQIVNRWANPRAYAIYQHAINNFSAPSEEGDLTPQWIEEQGGRKLGGDWYLTPDVGHQRIPQFIAELQEPRRLLEYTNPGLRVPLELLSGKRLSSDTEFSDNPEAVTGGAIGSKLLEPLLGLAGLAGPAQRDNPRGGVRRGDTATSQAVNYALRSLVPDVGRFERLAPNADSYEDRVAGSWLNWLGVPVRQVTDRQRDSERRRRAREATKG